MSKTRIVSIPSIILEDDMNENSRENAYKSLNDSYSGDLSVEFGLKSSDSHASFTSEAKRWTIRASQMIVQLPVEHLKKIAGTKSIGSLSRETEHFVGITTVHGPLRVFRGKGKYRWFWAGALILCVALFFYQLIALLQIFSSKPTVSQISYLLPQDGLMFPSITICNYNPIRKSYIQKLNQSGEFSHELLDYVMLSFLSVQSLLNTNNALKLMQGEDELRKYRNTVDPTFKIDDFFMEAGFECNQMLKFCSFDEQEFNCCSHAYAVLTDMGKCFRLDFGNSFDKRLQKQTQAGVNSGLQIIADFHREEQLGELVSTLDVVSSDSIFANELEDGFRYYVHSFEIVPYLSTEGISVSPGSRVYSAISPSKFTLLSTEAWGNCTDRWPQGFDKDTPYSSSECTAFCRANFFYNICQCSPIMYNLDRRYNVCTADQLFTCLRKNLAIYANDYKNREQLIMPECSECLVECSRWVYNIYNSYSFGFSQRALFWFEHQNSKWTSRHVNHNFVTMNVFFRDLSYTEYQQIQSVNFVQTLSNIGGNMGMSLLSVIEVIIFCYKSTWIFISKKRRQYMVEKKIKEREREKYLEETIEEAQRKAKMKGEEDEETFAERTFNRVRKFATAIRHRSMSVVWSNYQDGSSRKDVDLEANKRAKTSALDTAVSTMLNDNINEERLRKPSSNQSLKIDDGIVSKQSGGTQTTVSMRKTTVVEASLIQKKKSIVDKILHNRLFSSGAAKINKGEDNDELIELKIDLRQLFEGTSQPINEHRYQRNRSQSVDSGLTTNGLVQNESQRYHSFANLVTTDYNNGIKNRKFSSNTFISNKKFDQQ